MLKIKILVVFLLACMTTHACDICGCYMGFSPYQNFSSIGFFYRYRAFNGYSVAGQSHNLFPSSVFRVQHGSEPHDTTGTNEYSGKDYELYRVYELRGKYFIHRSIEINGVVPYYMNSTKTNGVRHSMDGIGDISMFMGFHILNTLENPVTRQRLVVGAGMKIPTGEYYLKDDDGTRYDALNQPGTGSKDVLLYVNYLLGHRKLGVSTNILYKMNGQNYYHERIGNSVTTYLNIFLNLKKNNFRFIPLVQVYHEYTKGLYTEGVLENGTRMHEMMIGPGFDIYFKNFLFNSSVQIPVFAEQSATQLGSAGRLVLGISYNFMQSKYLFHKKEDSSQ